MTIALEKRFRLIYGNTHLNSHKTITLKVEFVILHKQGIDLRTMTKKSCSDDQAKNKKLCFKHCVGMS